MTAGLPAKALLGAQSYLTVKAEGHRPSPGVYVPFLMVFGILGLAVAVLIVANVISGAVVAGFRHIGMLKALGFTPNQVMAVYLVMVSIPSVIGCVLGTVARQRRRAAAACRTRSRASARPTSASTVWVNVVALLGMPALVALAALVSALRARRLSAAQAISAGSAHARRARACGSSAGSAAPGCRARSASVSACRSPAPARSALTLAAVVLGVMTRDARGRRDDVGDRLPERGRPVLHRPGRAAAPAPGRRWPMRPPGGPSRPPRKLSDAEDEALLRVAARRGRRGRAGERAGAGGRPEAAGRRSSSTGETAPTSVPRVLNGHWPDGPGQVVGRRRGSSTGVGSRSATPSPWGWTDNRHSCGSSASSLTNSAGRDLRRLGAPSRTARTGHAGRLLPGPARAGHRPAGLPGRGRGGGTGTASRCRRMTAHRRRPWSSSARPRS